MALPDEMLFHEGGIGVRTIIMSMNSGCCGLGKRKLYFTLEKRNG